MSGADKEVDVPVVGIRHVACLSCGHVGFCVEHLFVDWDRHGASDERTAGPWYCKGCGTQHMIRLFRDGRVRLSVNPEKKMITSSVILGIEPKTLPIYLLVRATRLVGEKEDEADREDQERYLYEEGTCPVNWFGDVAAIMYDGKDDPHGIAFYIDTISEAPPEDSNLRGAFMRKHLGIEEGQTK